MASRLLSPVILLLTLPFAVTGQTTDIRTAWGDPDLQGIWDYRSMTPMERPVDLGDIARVTPGAVPALVQLLEGEYRDRQEGVLGADWSDHFDKGLAEGGRTSLIVAPQNGRLPPLTGAAARLRAERLAHRQLPRGPEDLLLTERCIMYKSAPLTWSGDNNNVQILQTPDVVVLLHEMIHEAIIIPIQGEASVSLPFRQWRGTASGWWEEDALVVETIRRHPQWTAGIGLFPTPDMRVVERFTRLAENTLDYEFTVHDPATYTSPWTATWPMARTEGPLYEYACH